MADLGVIVDTDIPTYILDDHLNLTGRVNPTVSSFLDDSTSDFEAGTTLNLSVTDDRVLLVPELRASILNNGTAILTPGTGSDWDLVLMDMYVLKHNGTYWMYYTAGRSSSLMNARHVGLATSADGFNFTKYSGNPIVRSRVNSYDYTNLMQPVVMVESGKFHMWYAGNHGNEYASDLQDIDICYATSTDGYNWTKSSSNPVIANGSPDTAWDGIGLRPADIIKVGSTYTLFYKGVGDEGGSGPVPRLGSHGSTDLKTWTENPNNPLFTGSITSWDEKKMNYMSVQRTGATYKMWTFADISTAKVGWLTSPDLVNWTASDDAFITATTGTIYSQKITFPRWLGEDGNDRLYFRGTSGNVNRFGVFELLPKAMEGTFTSRVLNTTAIVDVADMDWNWTNVGGGRVDLYIRWANDTSSWGDWTAFDNSSEPLGVSARYFQYRAELNVSSDSGETSLNWLELVYIVPVAGVEVNVDGAGWLSVDGGLTDWWANVSLHDGDYDILVRATDALGDQNTTTIPVKVDLYPPTGSILVEEGRWATNSTAVLIETDAQDTHGPIMMQLARNPDFTGASWGPLLTSERWQLLGDPEGNVTIFARFRDDAGRISETCNDSIVIDTKPPSGTLLINGGDEYTNTTDVSLSLTWTDLTGVVAMMVSNDPSFPNGIWQDPMDRLGWGLEDVDGERAVYVRIQDAVGWVTTLTDTIIYDSTPPSASVSIDGDADYTNSLNVRLSIALYDMNPVRIKLANAGDPWPGAFSTLSSPVVVPWRLAPGPDGERTVRMLVQDTAGNEYVTSDRIVLDTTPPEGLLVLNGGAAYTNTLLLECSLSSSDATSGLESMRIGNSADLESAAWQSVKDAFAWLLPPGDGLRTVYVELQDRAGNTAIVDATIVLDTHPPQGTLSIEGGKGYVASPIVNLTLDMSDENGLDGMRLTNRFGFTDEEWGPYSASCSWDLGASGGTRMVFVEVRDLAGNSFITSASAVLDLVDPAAVLVLEAGAEYTLGLTVGIEWTAIDDVGLAAIAFSEDPAFEGVEWRDLLGGTSLVGTEQLTLSPGEGLKTVHVRVVDLAGRTGQTSDDIWYVASRPEGVLVLGDGSGWTNVSRIEASVRWTGGSDATHFRVSMEEDTSRAEWVLLGDTTTVALGPASGSKTVYGQLLGPHGVTSHVLSGTITLDTDPPAVQILEPSLSTADGEWVDLRLSVSDELDPSPVVRWRVNGKGWHEYDDKDRVSLDEGRNLIQVEAMDAAGNVGAAEWTVTLERNLFVGGASWLIVLAILVAAGVVAVWYWDRRRPEGSQ